MDIIFRKAGLGDVDFLAETIIAAEKSGTETFSYTTIFGLDEEAAKKYITLMLLEEVDGCELSISSFFLAEQNGVLLGAISAWVEGVEGASSALKGNLLRFVLPQESFSTLGSLAPMLKELHIDNIDDTIQLGLVYVVKEARGMGLVGKLMDYTISELNEGAGTNKYDVYIQVFGGNTAAIKAYEKVGFSTHLTKYATSKEIENYLPSDSKLLLKLNT